MSSVATGTKVLLFAFLEFNSFDECNVALEYLKPYAHHDIIAECEWHNHSDVFFLLMLNDTLFLQRNLYKDHKL